VFIFTTVSVSVVLATSLTYNIHINMGSVPKTLKFLFHNSPYSTYTSKCCDCQGSGKICTRADMLHIYKQNLTEPLNKIK